MERLKLLNADVHDYFADFSKTQNTTAFSSV